MQCLCTPEVSVLTDSEKTTFQTASDVRPALRSGRDAGAGAFPPAPRRGRLPAAAGRPHPASSARTPRPGRQQAGVPHTPAPHTPVPLPLCTPRTPPLPAPGHPCLCPPPGGAPLSSRCSVSCRVRCSVAAIVGKGTIRYLVNAWEFAVRCCTVGRTISATCDDTAAWCGTADGYTNHRCRDDGCTAANVARNKEWRQRRRLEPTPNHVHGSDNGYRNYGCR
jgi:hypothetical protein